MNTEQVEPPAQAPNMFVGVVGLFLSWVVGVPSIFVGLVLASSWLDFPTQLSSILLIGFLVGGLLFVSMLLLFHGDMLSAYFPQSERLRCFLATAAGAATCWVAAFGVGFLQLYIVGQVRSALPLDESGEITLAMLLILLTLASLPGAIGGAFLGHLPWIILQRHDPLSRRWSRTMTAANAVLLLPPSFVYNLDFTQA